jgi:hypothetical protein
MPFQAKKGIAGRHRNCPGNTMTVPIIRNPVAVHNRKRGILSRTDKARGGGGSPLSWIRPGSIRHGENGVSRVPGMPDSDSLVTGGHRFFSEDDGLMGAE